MDGVVRRTNSRRRASFEARWVEREVESSAMRHSLWPSAFVGTEDGAGFARCEDGARLARREHGAGLA